MLTTGWRETAAKTEHVDLAVVLTDVRGVAELVGLVMTRSGLTVKEIAARLGVQPCTVYAYRTCYHKRPSIQWLARLCEIGRASCRERVCQYV